MAWMPLCAAGSTSLAVLDWGIVTAQLIAAAIVAAAAAFITTWATVRAVPLQIAQLGKKVDSLGRQVTDAMAERAACELREVKAQAASAKEAAHTYATRDEFIGAFGQQIHAYGRLEGSISDLHSRVTDVAKGLANLRGLLGKDMKETGQ